MVTRPRRGRADAIPARATGRIVDQRARHHGRPRASQLIWRIGLRLHVVVPVHNEISALPEQLRRLDRLRQTSGVEVTVVDGGSVDGGGELLKKSGLTCISARSGLTGVATGDQAIFVTRKAFVQLGGFPPLPLFEDIELCARLRGLGKLVRLPGTVTTSARRWENRGPWRTILRMWLLRAGYTLGLSTRMLARHYEAVR